MKYECFSDATVETDAGSSLSQSLPAVRQPTQQPTENRGGNPFASTPVPAVTGANLDDVLDGLHARLKQDEV